MSRYALWKMLCNIVGKSLFLGRKSRDEVIDYMKDADITVRKVIKNNNRNLDGLHIILKDECIGVTPILYLEEYYGAYLTGKMSIEECVGSIVDLRREQMI